MTDPFHRGICVETMSGRFVNLMEPDPETIDVDDLVHSLSLTCRFGGQCRRFYSVAEHSLLVHDLVVHEGGDENLRLGALLHDAAEAYLGDVPTPLKLALRYAGGDEDAYAILTRRMEDAIATRFDINPSIPRHPMIKYADLWALRIEAAHLMASRGEGWGCWPEGLRADVPSKVRWVGGREPERCRVDLRYALRRVLDVDEVI